MKTLLSRSAGGTAGVELTKYLVNQGFRFIGEGMQASVWQKAGLVHKFIEAKYAGQHEAYVQYCKQSHGNPHVVKVLDIDDFAYEGKRYVEITTELLKPLDNSLQGKINWIAKKVSHELDNAAAQKSALRTLGPTAYMSLMNDTDPFQETCESLYTWGKAHGYSMDLGTPGNVMRRGTVFVVVDPYV